MIRYPICLAALSAGFLLLIPDSRVAAQVNDLPALPFDHMTATSGGFANFSTNTTQADMNHQTSTSAGQGNTENSPEPATLTLLGLGGFGAWWHVRRRKAMNSRREL